MFDWLRRRKNPLHVGARVRLVQMDGCMAHVRGHIDEGRIELIAHRCVYGSAIERPWASIRLNDGKLTERCVDAHLWTRGDDGVMEYRQ